MIRPLPAALCCLPLCCLTLPAAVPAPHIAVIENRSGTVLRGIYLSPSDADHWGPDRARGNVEIGARLTIPLPAAACRWDIRIILADRPAEQLFRDRDLCRLPRIVVDGKAGRFLRDRDAPRWN